jgi:hypothetical protein
MSINYIIATYNGYCKRDYKFPLPKNVLKTHLNKIISFKSNISQITIMKAESDNFYDTYYDINDIIEMSKIPIKVIDCENYGYSMGQWLKAYELFPNFDLYLFIEDDYCPGMDNFDSILLECYNKQFPDNIGLLCSLVEGSNTYKEIGGYPLHFEGCVFINKETLEKLYTFPKWNENPRKWLDLINHKIDPYYNWDGIRKQYIGAYYQLSFSHLFTLSNIEHEDYLDIKYNNKLLQFPYWSDDLLGIHFYNKGGTIKKKYTLEDIHNSPIIPVQLANNDYIKFNTIL